MKKHPIQLIDIGVKELSIVTKEPPEHGEKIDVDSFTFSVGYDGFNDSTRIINIGLKFEKAMDDESEQISPEEDNISSLKIEIIGCFKVDVENFPIEKIDHWAQYNAPYILIPYIREHVYSLTQKCGFEPLVLPLFQVPSFTIENKD